MKFPRLFSRGAHVVRALQHRDYRIFYTGQFFSLVGTWMQSVAESWLVYKLTGSAALLGLMGFCSQIPILLMSPLGGAVADRLSRRKILITTQTIAMLLAALLSYLTLSHEIKVWHLFVIASLLGLTTAFDIPARQSLLIELVGKKDLLNAIALNATMFNAARVVGPAIAGILVASIGEGWCFGANAVSYIGVIYGLSIITLKPLHFKAKAISIVESILEGFTYVRQTPPVRDLLLLVGIVSLTGMPFSVLMPIFADSILKGGPTGMGILLGCSGIGALIGAVALAARRGLKGLGFMISCCGTAFSIGLILFAFSKSFAFSAIILMPIGFCMVTQMAATNTLLQAIVPDHFRGRVLSLYSMMFMGTAPIGALLAGWLADRIGAPVIVAGGAVVSLAAVSVFGARLPIFRQRVRPLLTQEMIGGEPAVEARPDMPTVIK